MKLWAPAILLLAGTVGCKHGGGFHMGGFHGGGGGSGGFHLGGGAGGSHGGGGSVSHGSAPVAHGGGTHVGSPSSGITASAARASGVPVRAQVRHDVGVDDVFDALPDVEVEVEVPAEPSDAPPHFEPLAYVSMTDCSPAQNVRLEQLVLYRNTAITLRVLPPFYLANGNVRVQGPVRVDPRGFSAGLLTVEPDGMLGAWSTIWVIDPSDGGSIALDLLTVDADSPCAP